MPMIINDDMSVTITGAKGDKVYTPGPIKGVDELAEAFDMEENLNILYTGQKVMGDPEDDRVLSIIGKIQHYTKEYADSLDVPYTDELKKNVELLVNRHNLKMGVFEDRVLKLSSGYLSRTMGSGATKKMSVQTLAKMSRVFGISMDRLIFEDLEKESDNLKMLRSFIGKLRDQTKRGEIVWDEYSMDKLIMKAREAKDKGVNPGYLTKYVGENRGAILKGTVASISNFMEKKDLWVVQYKLIDDPQIVFDFVLYDVSADTWETCFDVLFSSNDDASGILKTESQALYDEIIDKMNDIVVSKEAKAVILGYLEGGKKR